MNLKIVLCTCLIWLCSAHIKAQSCCSGGGSACCSIAGGGGCSILPELDKHVIGINYSYSLYNTTTYPGMAMMPGMDMVMSGPGVATKGTMNTLQLFGRFNLPKRFQIAVSLPVHFLREQSAEATDHSAGLGDASAMVMYSFFNPMKWMGKKSKHQLRLGIGVKAPTGKFNMTPDGLFTTDLQLGTGSVDFLFNVNYIYRIQQFGISVSSSYKKNLTNRDHYRFGDNLDESLTAFYVCKLPKGFSITPKAGVTYDHMFYNVYDKELLTGTGGEVLRGKAGFDLYYKQFALSAAVAPVILSVNHWDAEPVPVLSFEAGFFYSF